jgi:multidrug transporter EmrE-like cation transporter
MWQRSKRHWNIGRCFAAAGANDAARRRRHQRRNVRAEAEFDGSRAYAQGGGVIKAIASCAIARDAVMPPALRGVALAVLLSVVGVAADSVLKAASLKRSPFTSLWFVLGCVLSLAFAVIWVHLVHQMKMATAGLLYGVMSTLALVVIGVFAFGERLSVSEVTGVAMAIGAMALLGRVTG